MQLKNERLLLTALEVADLLQVKPPMVAKYVKRGYFPRYPLGKRYRYMYSDIMAFLASDKQVGNELANPNVN